MERRWFENIRQGLNVCDRDGDKIGTVGHVYRRPVGASGSFGGGVSGGGMGTGSTGTGGWSSGTPETTGMGSGAPSISGHLKVDTGFLGLGKDLYIPFDAIREVTSDCVYLNIDKDDISRTNWDVRPDYISGSETM